MKAKDIMTHPVVSIKATTPVDEIARLLVKHKIGGMPVVDDENHIIGMVSENDLFLKEKGMPFSAIKVPTLFSQWVDPTKIKEIYVDAHLHTAADVLDPNVVCVDIADDVVDIALLMAQQDLKRVPVLQDGRLVGIITRLEIIYHLALKGKA